MIRFLIFLFIISIISSAFAGEIMDISLRNSFLPESPVSGDEGMFENNGISVAARFPFLLSKKHILSVGGNYTFSTLNLIHEDIDIQDMNLHSVTLSPRMINILNKDWTLIWGSIMEYKSDVKTGSFIEGTTWSFMLSASRKFSESLRVTFGVFYLFSPFQEEGRPDFLRYAPIPLIDLKWNITEKLKFSLTLPHGTNLTYRFNRHFRTGIFAGLKGLTTGGHLISIETDEGEAKVKFNTLGVGAGISNRINFTKMLSLDILAGYSMYRNVKIASENKKYLSKKIPNTPFFMLNFSWGI